MDFEELKELAIAWIVLSVAFMIVTNQISLYYLLVFSFIIGVSFIFHELSHRQIARSNKFDAKFKIWPIGLVIALVSSFLGAIFAAPGAVIISPKRNVSYTRRELEKASLKISIAGPLSNIVLAIVFLLAMLFAGVYSDIFYLAYLVNVWLAIFNLLPIPPLDGSKIFYYNKVAWGICFIVALVLYAVLLI